MVIQNPWWQTTAKKKKPAQPSTSEWGQPRTVASTQQAQAPMQKFGDPSSTYFGTPAPKFPQSPGLPPTPSLPPAFVPGGLGGFSPGGQHPAANGGQFRGGYGSEEWQRAMLGAAADLFPSGAPIRRNEIPLIELGLNMQQHEMALMDRARGIQTLEHSRDQLGASPELMLANELATAAATGASGPFSDADIASRRQGIASGHRQANTMAQQGLEADFARRNIGGATPALELALLAQAGRGQTAQALGDFDSEVAMAREASRQKGLDSLTQLGAYQETLDSDILNAIADAYLNSEREQVDLAGLIESPLSQLVGANQYAPVPYQYYGGVGGIS